MIDWLKKVLRRSPATVAAGDPGPAPTRTVSVTVDEFYEANRDILDGMRFSATLQVRTPLWILEHHGEVFRGPPSQAPDYGGMAHGIWVPQTRGGLSEFLREGVTHASDAGPVVDTEYLPFLKAFRTIVEGPGDELDKIERLHALPKESRRFAAFWRALATNIPDFPESFFYMDLAEIDGVGRTTARRMFDAGIYSVQGLHSASDETLLAIKGVGRALVKKIRAAARQDAY